MILGAEIAMLFYGLYAMFKGQFTLSKTRIVRGSPARLAGLFLLLPLPLAFGFGFFMGMTGNVNPGGVGNNLNLALVEGVIVVVCLVIAMVIAFSSPYDTA